MAITFDDLPFVQFDGGDLGSARRGTAAILAALEKHRAPGIGFVNERQLEGADRAARVSLLQAWVDAGMTLGNHTYSHRDLNDLTVQEFQDEIVKGERTIRLLQPAGIRYFRHPMTHTGDTAGKRNAINAFLAQRQYVVAPHTIENSDFIFNRVYASARSRVDAGLVSRVGEAYVDHTLAAVAFAEAIAPQIFGREIPHTLLLHANDLNADLLDTLLRRLAQRGYRFVSLDEAMLDAAYRTEDSLVTRSGPTWLWRWRVQLGKTVSFAEDPEPPAWVLALFNSAR